MSEINQTDLNLNTDFTNRESQFPNRRIIKIISQTPNEIIADIERDEGNVSNNGTKINAEQFQNIETKLNNLQTQVTNKQGTLVEINELPQDYIEFESDPQTQINNILNNVSKIKNSYGGFSAGQNSNATYGVAVGNGASSTSGVSIGGNASASNGVAVGVSAKTGDGFAGGYQAKTVNENGVVIDAIQLGTGTNTQEKTLQVYNDNIYSANTHTLNTSNANIDNINAQNLNLSGSFTALSNIGGGFSISDPLNVGIELGRKDGQAGTPYIDFHTDGQSNNDFNARLLATGNELNITASDGLKINYNDGNLQEVISIKDIQNNNNGYLILQNGLIMQWGMFSHSSGQSEQVTFPKPFASLYSVVATWFNTSTDNTKEWNIRKYSNSGFKLRQNSNHSDTNGLFWLAIGIV